MKILCRFGGLMGPSTQVDLLGPLSYHQDVSTIPQTPGDLLPKTVDEHGELILTLYANGHLVPCDKSDVTFDKDGITATVTFETTRNCLAAGTGDPRIERVWGNKKSGQMWMLRSPHPNPPAKYPQSGVVIIDDVVIPANESDGVLFRCHANTQIVDWSVGGEVKAQPGQRIVVPVAWFDEPAAQRAS